MTTIKSYTDISQSKKLAEILPLESADMHSEAIDDEGNMVFIIVDGLGDKTKSNYGSPVWSLAALLGILPKTFNYNNHTYQFMYNTHAMFYINVDNYDEDTFCSTNENLIDACYELIIRLHQLNLLRL